MHPLISDAADGRFPEWAEATPERRDHMVRVADVMEAWGRAMRLDDAQLRRWRATALLHDALRDADPRNLRSEVPEPLRELPDGMLHGPATAARLEAEGVEDPSLVTAVRWHTLGHPDFDRLGRALYLADFTEPGRGHEASRMAGLRARVPQEMGAVLVEVAADRIGRTLAGGHPLREPTVGFWNRIVAESDGG